MFFANNNASGSVEYLEPNDIIGLNLYAYCYDNPIMYYDPNGHSLLAIFLILAATTIVGGVIGAKKASDEGKKGWDFAKDVILGASMGLAVGRSCSRCYRCCGWSGCRCFIHDFRCESFAIICNWGVSI